MSQGVVYVALYVLGVVFHLGFGPRARPGLCCALGFLTGLAVWGVGALAVIASPLRYEPITVAAAYTIPLCISTIAASRRWRPTRRDLAVIGAWTVGFAAVVAWLCSLDASRFSPDSQNLVMAGLRLADAGSADLGAISTRGVFQILAHSLAAFTGDDYAWALSSVVGLSIAPVFIALAWRAAPRGVVVAAAAAVITTYNVAFHLFYIHTNIGAAAYLLATLGLLWLAETEQDPAYLPGALVCLAAFTLHRIEGPAFAAIVIIAGVYPSRLPRGTLGVGLALFAIPCALWYVLQARAIGAHPLFTPTVALALAAGTISLLVGFLAIPAALRAHAPRALALALVLAIAAGAMLEPATISDTARALVTNLLDPPLAMWGYTWHVVIALSLLALLAPPLSAGRTLAYGALCTVLMIVLLGVRHPYRPGVTDSANRMMLQVLPVAMLYLTLALGPLVRRRS